MGQHTLACQCSCSPPLAIGKSRRPGAARRSASRFRKVAVASGSSSGPGTRGTRTRNQQGLGVFCGAFVYLVALTLSSQCSKRGLLSSKPAGCAPTHTHTTAKPPKTGRSDNARFIRFKVARTFAPGAAATEVALDRTRPNHCADFLTVLSTAEKSCSPSASSAASKILLVASATGRGWPTCE